MRNNRSRAVGRCFGYQPVTWVGVGRQVPGAHLCHHYSEPAREARGPEGPSVVPGMNSTDGRTVSRLRKWALAYPSGTTCNH